jgi:benzodiazapine receptor
VRTTIAILVGIAACLAVGTAPVAVARPDAWYAGLAKPSWSPPNAAFGIVWPVLFTLMGTAAGLAWCSRPAVLVPFAVQLLLNAAWSPIFFRYHRLGASVAELCVLWCAIVVTVVAFARVRASAAWLLVPYLLWVTFAAGLNVAIWRLNR